MYYFFCGEKLNWNLNVSQSVEPGGASHATGVSAEWPSLIGESANQLKMEMFFGQRFWTWKGNILPTAPSSLGRHGPGDCRPG